MAALMLFAFTPMQLIAAVKPELSSVVSQATIETTKGENLLLRLNEINEIDKSTLNSAKKKELRKEVRSIKSELKHLGGGIYISASAALIIIILLILLL